MDCSRLRMALACTLHSPASSSPGIKRSRARRVGSRLSALICRVEDAIRTGKDTGPGHFPSFDYGINAAWLTAAMTGQILLAWLRAPGPGRRPRQGRAQDTALPGAAHRRPPGTRRTAALPENPGHLAVGRCDHGRVAAYRRDPASPLTSANRPRDPGRRTPGPRGTPGHPARQPGHCHTPTLKSMLSNTVQRRQAPAISPDERSGLGAP